MTKLRVMSSNLWWCDGNHEAWAARGEDCSAAARSVGLYRMYRETQPDIIGLQECSARMTHQLMTRFAEDEAPYSLLWGRDTSIIYRRDKFQLVDSEVCIYPEEIPGLEGSFNNLNTKSYCLAVLRLKDTDETLIFATTHLWYKSDRTQPHSEEAKAWQLNRLMDRLDALQDRYGCPGVIVGDMNTWYTGAAVQSALKRGFVHGHDAATEAADETSGMHECCDKGYETVLKEGGFPRALDHILIRGQLSVQRFQRYCPDYYWPLSDHSPVWIDAQL